MVTPITLTQALRAGTQSRIAIVGAGGKTTLLFRLAREFTTPVIVTTSTHLALSQAALADQHLIIQTADELDALLEKGMKGVTLITSGLVQEGKIIGLPDDLMVKLKQVADILNLPVLIEADGSRGLPLKAPAEHEPPIPVWVDQVVVVAGMSGLGQPLDKTHMHRAEIFSELTHAAAGSLITADHLVKYLISPSGGLKNIPASARKVIFFNQADDEIQQALAGQAAKKLIGVFDCVIVGQLQDALTPVKAVFQPVAGILLAAGKSSRMGEKSKVLLDWQGMPFVRQIAQTALAAELNPVVVVTGAHHQAVEQALEGLPVVIAYNSTWEEGQSSSIKSGVNVLPKNAGAAIFLLADQPQVSGEVLSALIEQHYETLSPIIAPMVEDRRANPVLFDHSLFEKMQTLSGDTGGRALFSQASVQWLPWSDPLLLMDVDTPEDLDKLRSAYEERHDARPG